MCEFRIQDCRHSPWEGLPQMAPWHHVGATMEITLDKNGSLYDPAGTESWNMQIRNCDNRANVSCSSLGFLAWPQALHPIQSGSFVGRGPWLYATSPCTRLKKGEDRRKKKREVLHLFRCYTHTPGQSRVSPERQEEEKSGHTKGKRPKTAQGGEGNRRTSGTNLHGETDLTKTAHTPKPHDTLRRGTRGKLGTKWGTSWWQTGKPKNN